MRRLLIGFAFGFVCHVAVADSIPQPQSASGQAPVYATVASLPASAANGATAFASNCRAITGAAVGAFNTQGAGAGTGCLVTYSTAGTPGWDIAGTTMAPTQ